MQSDYETSDWARHHDTWARFASDALKGLRDFISWWGAHRPWPANEPTRILEQPGRPHRQDHCPA